LVNVGKPAVPGLLALLENEDPDIHDRVLWVLEKLDCVPRGDRQAEAAMHGKWRDLTGGSAQSLEGLTRALRDPSRQRRVTAAQTLARIGDGRVVQPLASLLGDPDREVRETAIHALVKMGVGAVDYLLSVLRDPDAELRPQSVELLGYI